MHYIFLLNMSVVYPQVLNKEDWRALEYIVNGWRFDPT